VTLYRGYQGATTISGGPAPGAKALMAWFLATYPAGTNLGIYNPKVIPGTQILSLHAEGRACDLGCPRSASWAAALADLLRIWSAELGIQCVIHDRRIWSGAYPDAGWRPYAGSDPHDTHLHVELTWYAARYLTVDQIRRVNTRLSLVDETTDWTDDIVSDLPTLRQGATGHAVRIVQGLLDIYGFSLRTDGIFGPLTHQAVSSYQVSHRVANSVVNGAGDGIVGPMTWRSLLGL